MRDIVTQDLWGELLRARYAGLDDTHLVVRDDGYIEEDTTEYYFLPYRRWFACEQKAATYVRGRTLDIGCGAGRVSLWLQRQGLPVTGLDVSPRALEVASARGVRRLILAAWEDAVMPEAYDTLVLLGNNLGMTGTLSGVRRMLTRLRSWVAPDGQLVFSALDPDHIHGQKHERYMAQNEAHGRYRAEFRLRLKWRGKVSPWFGWLMLDPATLRDVCDETGWRVDTICTCQRACYGGVLRPT